MVTTLLILCIPLTAAVVGFFVLKSVQLGLRWQMQVVRAEPPTLDVPDPVQRITESKQAAAQKDQTNILAEWLNGPTESR